jgi:hypothetical protein
LERCYKNIRGKDARNDKAWNEVTGAGVKRTLDAKKKPTLRVRACTRGEPFAVLEDLAKVLDIAKANPSRVFWCPTRAWRSPALRAALEPLRRVRNLRILASIDPSNTPEEVAGLVADGWSTMYFGDDTATDGRIKCPKTWGHVKGACATCKNGCFSRAQVHVHLKKH